MSIFLYFSRGGGGPKNAKTGGGAKNANGPIFYIFTKVYFTLTCVKIISCFNLMLIIQVVRYIMYLYYRELILSLCRVLFDIKYIFNKIVFRQIIQMTRTS